MSFQIMREIELTMVPVHLLRNPNLSLATKGAATVLGVSEERAIAICHELQDAGYGNMFRVSGNHD